MVPPHPASLAQEQDSLTVTLGIVRDIVTEVLLLHFQYNHMLPGALKHQIGIFDHLNIYQVVVRQVARRGVRVSDQLVAALLKSVFQVKESTQWEGLKSTFILQNPDNGFGSERPLDRDDVRRLVRQKWWNGCKANKEIF